VSYNVIRIDEGILNRPAFLMLTYWQTDRSLKL